MSDLPVLVTGASGFLGRRVVPGLLAEGKVTTLTREPFEGHCTITGDITDPELRLGHRPFSTVYHLAGWAHRVPQTDAEREMFFRVNAEGTGNLLRALERTGGLPQAFVLISTVAVYGLETGERLDESTARNATDAYGASKRLAEDIVMEWGGRRGVRVGIVRLPLVAGPGAPGNLGAMVRALRCGKYLGIGSGAARRSMVWAEDVGKILSKIAGVGGVFHLTDGQHPSFAELETALSGAVGKRKPWRLPLRMAKLGAWTGDVVTGLTGRAVPLNARSLSKMTSTLTFSDERARTELGWNPSRVLDHAAELVN